MILDDLKGKRALITGASAGIGAGLARAFAQHGVHVAIHYHHGAAAAEALLAEITAEGGTGAVVAGDLRSPDGCAAAVEAAVAALGGLDILVNNAGGLVRRAPLAGYDDATLEEVLALNIGSVLATTRAAHPHLKASGAGAVINTGSVAGRTGGRDGSGLYGAAKAFVHAITKAMAKEFAADAIRVNAVAPGVILTRFHDETTPERMETTRKGVPLQRLGTVEECAGTYLYLASAAASGYVTGAILDVNGGTLMP